MPTSKTRKKTAPRDRPSAPPATGKKALEVAALALTQAALQLVQESELHIRQAARDGDEFALSEAFAVHHELRSGTLGFLVAYSRMAGLPDPREGRD